VTIQVLRQMGAALGRWRRRRAGIRALNELSDRQLQDIGLTRGQIPETVEAMLDRPVPAARSATVITLRPHGLKARKAA
jgi:uncharacterized protein YjiS (DUF1127 family)